MKENVSTRRSPWLGFTRSLVVVPVVMLVVFLVTGTSVYNLELKWSLLALLFGCIGGGAFFVSTSSKALRILAGVLVSGYLAVAFPMLGTLWFVNALDEGMEAAAEARARQPLPSDIGRTDFVSVIECRTYADYRDLWNQRNPASHAMSELDCADPQRYEKAASQKLAGALYTLAMMQETEARRENSDRAELSVEEFYADADDERVKAIASAFEAASSGYPSAADRMATIYGIWERPAQAICEQYRSAAQLCLDSMYIAEYLGYCGGDFDDVERYAWNRFRDSRIFDLHEFQSEYPPDVVKRGESRARILFDASLHEGRYEDFVADIGVMFSKSCPADMM